MSRTWRWNPEMDRPQSHPYSRKKMMDNQQLDDIISMLGEEDVMHLIPSEGHKGYQEQDPLASLTPTDLKPISEQWGQGDNANYNQIEDDDAEYHVHNAGDFNVDVGMPTVHEQGLKVDIGRPTVYQPGLDVQMGTPTVNEMDSIQLDPLEIPLKRRKTYGK